MLGPAQLALAVMAVILPKRAKHSEFPEVRAAIAKAMVSPQAIPEQHAYPKSELRRELDAVFEKVLSERPPQVDGKLKNAMAVIDLARHAIAAKLVKGMNVQRRNDLLNEWLKEKKGLPPFSDSTFKRYFRIRPL